MDFQLSPTRNNETINRSTEQLKSIYEFCSEKFQKSIDSPQSLFESVNFLLNNNQSNSKSSKSNNNLVEETVSMFEELINTQLQEIESLSKQRDELTQIVKKYDQVSNQFEEKFKQMRDYFNSQSQKQIYSFDNQLFKEINSDIHKIGIESHQISKSRQIRDFIIETISNIINSHTGKTNSIETDDKKFEKDKSIVSTKKYQMIFNQLEGSIKFIQNIANSNQELNSSILRSSLINDEVTRSLLLSQISRIGHYIDQNDLQPLFQIQNQENLFDPKLIENPQEFLEPLLDGISTETMLESPFREFYLLLIGTMEVNKFIMDRIEAFERRNRDEIDNAFPVDKEELLFWKNEYDTRMKLLAEQIGAVDIPPEELLDHFLDVYLDTVEENKELQNTIIDNQEEFKETQKQNVEQIKSKLDEIEQLAAQEKEKHQEQVAQLNQQLSQSKSENDQLVNSIKQLNLCIQNKDNEFQKANDELTQLKELIKEVDQKAQSVGEINNKLNKDIEKLANLLRKQNEGIVKASNKIEKLYNQKSALKLKLIDIKTKSSMGMSSQQEIKNEIYISEINKLENEVSELQIAVKNMEDEKAKIISQKDDLTNQLVKMRVSEKAMKIKLDALENRSTLNKQENEHVKSALISSINAEAAMKVEKIRNEYEKLRSELIRILKYKYKVKFMKSFFASYEENESFIPSDEIIIRKVDELISASIELQNQSNDIQELRLILGIPEPQTLANGAKTISGTISNLTKQNSEYRARNDLVIQRSAELEMKRNEQENAIRIAQEWEQWSKSILFRITNGTATFHGPNDIKFLLEEALLSTIGHQNLLLKLDILQAQKKLFLTFSESECLFAADESSTSIDSLRMLMVIVMFLRRLRVLSHSLNAPSYI